MKRLVPAIVVIVYANAALASEPCFPGFKGAVKTLVTFAAGPKNGDFFKVAPDHLAFLHKELATGHVQYGGPLLPFDANTPPSGGMLIYNSANIDEVRAVAEQDPLVTSGVFNYSLRNWVQCTNEN